MPGTAHSWWYIVRGLCMPFDSVSVADGTKMRIFFAAILVVALARAAQAQGTYDATSSAALQKRGSGVRET